MNKDDSLKCISYLSDVIGLLSGKWERPHTDIEVAILQQLHDVQETIRRAYEAEQEPVTKTTRDKSIEKLRALLAERGYDLEIEQEPTYSPPFTWTFAAKDEVHIPLCSTQSYYMRQGIEHLPGWLDRALEQ